MTNVLLTRKPSMPSHVCSSFIGMPHSPSDVTPRGAQGDQTSRPPRSQFDLNSAHETKGQDVPRSLGSQPGPLSSCSLQGIAELISSGRAQRIVVMAGAGISVSAGIPDFRSPGTGLYSRLQRFALPRPEAVFDLAYFRHNPAPFYALAKELFPGHFQPTPTHHFLRLLSDKGLLLSVFTQNIDDLEAAAGLPQDKVVHAHGSFSGAHCIDCGRATSLYAVQQAAFDDEVAHCSSCGGLVKPDIVFFGERLPAAFHRRRLSDLGRADLLIVMGTSLVVQPFAGMIDAVPHNVPRLLINMNRVGEGQQQQQQQRTLCAHKLQQQQQHRQCGSHGSYGNDRGSSSSDDDVVVDDDGEGGASGWQRQSEESSCDSDDATSLTASSSCASISSGSSGAAAAGASSAGAAGSNRRSSSQGFDFNAGLRDVLHLGECDASVTRLAELLGWGAELAALVEAGRREFEQTRLLWQD